MANYGWFWPYEDACIVSPRPEELHRDDRGRLHSAEGQAVVYPDGWGVYAWHGMVVREAVIRGTYGSQDIFLEPNAEIRRAMLERMGPDRFFAEVQAEEVDADQDGRFMPRRLLRVAIQGSRRGYIQAVQVTCPSTGREYFLGVPSSVRTCQEAVAATFGVQPEQWAPEYES